MIRIFEKKYVLVVTGLLAVLCVLSANAVPFHYPDTVNHPADPPPPSWKDGDEPYHHQHRSAHTVMDWGNGEGKYDANKVWTNENLNYVGDSTHGSHGFIVEDPVSAPDFYFAGDWTLGDGAKAKARVSQAFGVWSAIESDNANLIMGLLFSEMPLESVAEIKVHWATATEFPGLANNVAFFDPNPQGSGSDTYYDLVFDRNNGWYFDSDKAGFLASDSNTVYDDFYTVALHETGHVVGLTHQTDLDDIMETLAGSRASVAAGGAFRALSGDDLNGARDLYSVPVPEPITAMMLGFGAVWFFGRRKK